MVNCQSGLFFDNFNLIWKPFPNSKTVYATQLYVLRQSDLSLEYLRKFAKADTQQMTYP